jgi:outer membrane protein
VLSGVVTAYLDTQRDATVVDLNRNQVRVLQEQLRASRDRFEVGDLTRTDVAQSEARLSLAQSNLRLSEAQLVASQENYRRVVGHGPGVLAPPPPLPALPGTVDQAVDLAVADNPTLGAARINERAATYDVNTVRANRLPTVVASTGVRYQDTFANAGGGFVVGPGGIPVPVTGSSSSVDKSHNVGIVANVPLYQGGLVSGQIRQAQARRSQAMEQIVVAERNVVASARNAYEGVISSNAVIDAAKVAVDANALALEGTRQENLVGSRNILDVLNAEQELLNSRVTLVRAQRDAYVAGFTLLSAIGRADSESLNLTVQRYDPEVNYRDTRGVWNDWDEGAAPRPVAQPTAPTTKPGGTPAPAAAQPATTTTTTVTTTTK